MPVDRGHDGARAVEDGEERLAPGRPELPGIGNATVDDATQVDACGERTACAGEHDGAGRGDLAHPGRDRTQQLEIERVDLAVLETYDGNVTFVPDLNHLSI